MKKSAFKYLILFLLVFLFSAIVNAQKLPNKQETSLRSPGNIKIDGRAAEWGGQFAAYNKNTKLSYTVSNNDDNLYLTVQATDSATIQQIITHGLTFTVNGSAKKNDKQHVAITFPLFKNFGDYRSINRNLAYNPAFFLTNPIDIKRVTDSLVYTMNNEIITKSNEFSVTGISSGADTTLQIDNKTGIKAIGLFENKNTYTLEFSIPVKYLEGHLDKLSYNVKINGTPAKDAPHIVTRSRIVTVNAQDLSNINQELMKTINSTPRPSIPVVDEPIDFWGEYTLAKK